MIKPTMIICCLFALALMPFTNAAYGEETIKPQLVGKLIQGSLIRGQLPAGSLVKLNDKAVEVNQHGEFVFGFPRDAELTHTLRWKTPETEIWKSDNLTIEKRDYRIQRIDGIEQSKVTPPQSVLSRIRDEAARVAKARSILSDNSGFKDDFIWPSDGRITGIYGSQRVLNGKPSRPHFGIDIAAPTGTEVIAPAAGRVTMAEPDLYYSGVTLIVDHGLGVFSTFLHLHSMNVKVGDWVEQGQKIGEVGSTGRSTGPHLDWRINWYKERLDPALLVEPREGLDYY